MGKKKKDNNKKKKEQPSIEEDQSQENQPHVERDEEQQPNVFEDEGPLKIEDDQYVQEKMGKGLSSSINADYASTSSSPSYVPSPLSSSYQNGSLTQEEAENQSEGGNGVEELAQTQEQAQGVSQPRGRFDFQSEEQELKYFTHHIYLLIKPIIFTLILTVWWVRTINLANIYSSSFDGVLIYQEDDGDSTGQKIGGAIVNALIIVGILIAVTFFFVCLFYFNCMKIIYGWLFTATTMILGVTGGVTAVTVLTAYNYQIDWLSFIFILWNFAVVGLVSIFSSTPLYIQQGYLIIISALLATNLTQLPTWTAWALLAFAAIYDLFAVLCPKGPLRMLVNISQERNQPIPGLLYSTGMANLEMETDSPVGGYVTRRERDEEEDPQTESQRLLSPNTEAPTASESINYEEVEEEKGVFLGLGDFIFYSVLVGQASLSDWMTVVTCSVACITGLCMTLLLLAIYKHALPALPISIGLGILFYFISSVALTPYFNALASGIVFI